MIDKLEQRPSRSGSIKDSRVIQVNPVTTNIIEDGVIIPATPVHMLPQECHKLATRFTEPNKG